MTNIATTQVWQY